jgi:polar amino acid transport system substrate-binding protein
MKAPSAAAKADLAPTGVLRVGVNLSNALLTARGESGRDPTGVAVDVGRELGRRLGVPVKILPYESPGQMAEAVTTGVWDVAFLAIDPEREKDIKFAPAYVEIEATYLVRSDSKIKRVADVDKPGVRVSVSEKSGYDPYLTRTLKHAHLERGKGIPGAIAIFSAGKADAVAALKPVLLTEMQKMPGTRILDDSFTSVQQAIGMPKGRDAGAQYLHQFVKDVISEGFVAVAIEKNKVKGLTVTRA